MEQVRFRRPEPSDPLDQRKAAIITKPCCVLARGEVLLGRQADITGHMVFTLRLVRQTKLRSVFFRRCLETVKLNTSFRISKTGRPFSLSLSHRECNVAVCSGATIPGCHSVIVQTGKCSHNRVPKPCANISLFFIILVCLSRACLGKIFRGFVIDYQMAPPKRRPRTVPRDVAVNCLGTNGLCFECVSLCLSRACLGKMFVFN